MEYDKNVDNSGDAPAVPEKIRQKLHRHLLGLHTVVVEEETQKGRFKKVNKLRLSNKSGEFPEEEIEDIAEGIMYVIQSRDETREESEGPINFRLTFEQRSKDGKRARPSIEYTFDPESSFDDFGDGMNDDSSRDDFFHGVLEYVSRLHFQLNESHEHIREISKNNQMAIKPMMDALGWMGHFYAAGLQTQQHAMGLIYDVKKVQEEERQKTIRQEKWMEFLKKPATAAVGQFMQWAGTRMDKMRDKARQAAESAGIDLEPNMETPPEPPDVNETFASVKTAGAQTEEALTEEERNNPIATIASSAASTFTPEQWFTLNDVLTKKELAVLRKLVSASDDASAIKAYDEFSDFPMSKLQKLNDILGDEQKEVLGMLGQLVEKAKEGWGDGE